MRKYAGRSFLLLWLTVHGSSSLYIYVWRTVYEPNSLQYPRGQFAGKSIEYSRNIRTLEEKHRFTFDYKTNV
jgi:hypothetical protein